MPVISDIITTNRASTGTYFDANGVMQVAANNVWRMDHDPATGAPRGVLIEEQRTNVMLRSGDPGGTGYTVSGMTVTLNAGVAPNGENVATLLVENTSTGLHRTAQTPSDAPVAGTAFWNSVFVKKLPGSPRSLVVVENLQYANHTKRTTAYFDLDTGQFVSVVGTLPEARVEALSDGWFRLYTFGEAAGTGPVGLNVGLALNTTTLSYEGDGVSGIYVWGFQREDGLFPTSYIPTTTAAATRAADALQITNGWSQPWASGTAGTLLFEFRTKEDPPSGTSTTGPSIIGQTGTGGMFMHLQGTSPYRLRSGYFGVGGIGVFANSQPSVGVGAFAKVASAYGAGEFVIAVNGDVQIFATSAGGMVKDGDLRIGYRAVANNLNGHIRSITYYPRRLSDAELQAATVLP